MTTPTRTCLKCSGSTGGGFATANQVLCNICSTTHRRCSDCRHVLPLQDFNNRSGYCRMCKSVRSTKSQRAKAGNCTQCNGPKSSVTTRLCQRCHIGNLRESRRQKMAAKSKTLSAKTIKAVETVLNDPMLGLPAGTKAILKMVAARATAAADREASPSDQSRANEDVDRAVAETPDLTATTTAEAQEASPLDQSRAQGTAPAPSPTTLPFDVQEPHQLMLPFAPPSS
jgi:hypothetical protein